MKKEKRQPTAADIHVLAIGRECWDAAKTIEHALYVNNEIRRKSGRKQFAFQIKASTDPLHDKGRPFKAEIDSGMAEEKSAAKGKGAGTEELKMPLMPGERFTWKGLRFVALGMEQGGMLAITEEPLCERKFDERGSNDWRKSSLRLELNGTFLDNIGKESLMPFTSDLTSDDGLKDYGTAEDYVFLLSADLYRKYRPYIPNQKTWWWLITPWSTLPSFANYVCSSNADGSLYNDYANGTIGVVAGLLFNPESIQLGKEVLRQQHGG